MNVHLENSKVKNGPALLARKLGMTQVFGANGVVIPVTVLEAGPCYVVQVKTQAADGYNAVQIGFQTQRENLQTQPMRQHFKKAGVPCLRVLKEFRLADVSAFKVGQALTLDQVFQKGQKVDITGQTIGRGFQGVMKRYDFGGQPDTHGSMMHRRPGSIGMRQTPGHVYKQRKMPGHMGGVMRTVQNLEVIDILPDRHLILVRGSFPGCENSVVVIRDAKKNHKQKA
jgi:large subunit ribosomal protein L3